MPQQDYDVFLFGSRATGTNKQWSDFDVGILGNHGQDVPAVAKFDIQDNLDRLNVLYIVGLVDFKGVTDNFKRLAFRKVVPWTN